MSGGIFRWAAPLFALEARRWSDADASTFANWLGPSVAPGGSVLDLGGGTGRLGELLAAAIECSVTILDSSPQMLRYASKRAGVTTVHGDAAAMPFDDSSFDGVIVVDAFHHFARQSEASREIARVLRVGGTLVVAELDPDNPGVRRAATWERLLREPGSFLPPRELAALFSAAGIRGECRPQSVSSYVFVGARDPGRVDR